MISPIRVAAAALVVSMVPAAGGVCVAAEAAPQTRAPRPGSFAAYLALVARYRWSLSSAAPVDDTLHQMLSWRDRNMASSVGRLIRRLKAEDGGRATLCDPWMDAQADAMVATGHLALPPQECDLAALLRSAVALHTEAAARAAEDGQIRRGLEELSNARFLIGELPESERSFRHRARLTCGYLAQSNLLLGCALTFLQEVEGESDPGPETLLALASAYEVYALTCVSADGQTFASDACVQLGKKGRLWPTPIPDYRARLLALAEARLRQALLRDPLLTSVRLRLGHVQAVLGRSEAAAHLVVVKTTSDDPAERSLASLFLARLAERNGRADEALDQARDAVRDAPSSQTARVALARALFIAGEREAAAQEALGVLTSEPQPVDSYLVYRLGIPWFFSSSIKTLRADVW